MDVNKQIRFLYNECRVVQCNFLNNLFDVEQYVYADASNEFQNSQLHP